jgi:serine/threonine protein kinase
MAEMFLQRPLFAGKHAHDQLARIMRVLGSPDSAILRKMATELQRPDLVEQECGFLPAKNFADVCSVSNWSSFAHRSQVLPSSAPREASDLLRQMIVYVPSARIRMGMCLSHPFFDAVRSATIILPSGKPCPPLLNFSQTEREYMGTIVSEI